jgi:hypothetical protein
VPGYGRSTNHNDNYRWRAYYRWRPALVGFFDAPSPRGHYVGWYPLAPGQRWRRPDWQRRDGDHSHLQYPTTRDGWQRPGRSTFILPPHDGRGVTLLPVEGFNRSDRSKNRPVAPDADLSNWIKRGARPGLPEIKPAPIAIAPVTRDGQRNRIAIPSNEIIHRPVVTRNRPSDSQVTVNPPRERRLITPRTPVMSNDEPTRREKKVRTDEQRMKPPAVASPPDGQNSNPSNEKPNRRSGDSGVKPHVMPAERVDGDNNQSERKAKRGNEVTVQPSPDKGSGNDSSNERQKRPVYTPQPKQDNSANSDDTRMRERRPRDEEQNRQRDEERAKQRDEERQRQNAEESAKQREEQNRQRDQERTRQRDEERARQNQEERQRRNDEERTRQRNEERQREKPPEHNNATPRQEQPKPPRSEPAREERRQEKQERRAEQEPRKKP